MSFPIIALWSHPRSMSTAFERIMRARGDLTCLHEPFMYEYYINRARRRMPLFEARTDHPVSYADIRAMILSKAETAPVFFKDMSYYVVPHIFDDLEFFARVTHSFLIRDPKAALVSYAKLDPDFTCEEAGLEAQWRHAESLMQRGIKPVIVRSEEVQADPAGAMRNYWAAVGLADMPRALEWNEEAPQDWNQVSGWHRDVLASTSVRPPDNGKSKETADSFDKLMAAEPRFRAIYEHHMPFYERLLALTR